MDTEANELYGIAHRVYDAALFTKCYTQLVPRPYIDSEVNHFRHFIKIQFVNKRIEIIYLSHMFKDNLLSLLHHMAIMLFSEVAHVINHVMATRILTPDQLPLEYHN